MKNTYVTILVLVAIALGAWALLGMGKKAEAPKACTMEAKLCPDGSYVGRSGPNCEFAACPTSASLNTSLKVQ